ncbi:sperm-egg fusion protein TMEM95 isoform X2 [Arvicanthis niloticus]|uniref:sperm-egg fusion protein TMEM95 isoform X2 n=1 Tax=Arvicanthis niloticus TaxID=61156 RepID=UPI00402B89E2
MERRGNGSAKGLMACLKPLSNSGVGAMRVRDPTTPGWSLELGFPNRAALTPPRLMNGPEDLHWGLSQGSTVDSLACSCWRMGPLYSEVWKNEVSMNQITEKTHRVLRVIEIKRSIFLLPSYWQWLQKTKIPQYTREDLCAPICRGSTILYNCSTCEGKEESCWPQKRCFPGSHDLWDARILLLCIFGIVLLLGALSLRVEYLQLQAKDL